MNKSYRDTLMLKIKHAISESAVISDNIKHKYLAGKHKEIVVSQLIKPILPYQYNVGTGKVCDSNTFISNETDIIIYSNRLIQPLIFEFNLGLFPIESVLTCIEVKTKLNATEYKSIFKKFKYFNDNARYSTGFFGENDENIETKIFKPTFEIFAFDTNIKKDKNYHIKEFNRYKSVDEKWETNPVVQSICIVNRGWWIFWKNKWNYHSPENLSETIMYLANNINSLNKIEESRGNPRLGLYLTKIDGLKEI
jgi:hypothetical protein